MHSLLKSGLIEVWLVDQNEGLNRNKNLMNTRCIGIPGFASSTRPRAQQGQAYLSIFVQVWVESNLASPSRCENDLYMHAHERHTRIHLRNA